MNCYAGLVCRHTGWNDLPPDVQCQILGLLSLAELGRVAPVCTFWHSAFAKEADRLRVAHTSFDLEAVKDSGTVSVRPICKIHPFLTAPLLEGLGRAWDTVCAYLSKPYHHSLSCWVDADGHIVGGVHPPGLALSFKAFVYVFAHAMDRSGRFCPSKAWTTWHIFIRCYNPEHGAFCSMALHFLCMCGRRGQVMGPPRMLFHACCLGDCDLLYFCIVLMIGERLGGTLGMLAQRLVPRGVAVLPAQKRGEALIQDDGFIFGLGKLLLYRTFRESNQVIRFVTRDDAHHMKRKTCTFHKNGLC
jgi:F-box-like